MRHLIAIGGAQLAAGGREQLLGRESGLGVTLVRGGGPEALGDGAADRYLFILEGELAVAVDGATQTGATQNLGPETLIVVPSNARLQMTGNRSALWLEFVGEPSAATPSEQRADVSIARADPTLFDGGGFAHQMLAGRETHDGAIRVNALRVDAGAGSPDYHIHDFDQFYVILEGEMVIDIGRRRLRAGPMTLVHLPAGLVHRNFNAGPDAERHISLLAPEPLESDIFDYAVEIHDREAEFFDANAAMSANTKHVPERA